ncbi:hypothetical protein LTS18_013003, partial [Coniosporium uncinatum]
MGSKTPPPRPAVLVGTAVAVGQEPSRPTPRMLQITELTTEVTVAKGAEGTTDVAAPMMDVTSVTAEAGSSDTIDSTAETTGSRGSPAEAEGQDPSRPTPSISQTTELTTEVTVAAGADGTSDLPLVTWDAGSSEIMDSTAEMTGAMMPPGATVFEAPALPVGQPPRTPTPKISQTTEFTTEVTVAKGAEGLIEVTSLIIELTSDAAGETTGSCETIDSTAETIGGRRPPGTAVVKVTLPDWVEQPPRTPTPRISHTTEFTTEVTVPKGADGLIEVTTSIIELISDAAGDATGSSDTIDSTAETIGGKRPPGAAVVGAPIIDEVVGQPPRTPTPRISHTTEFTTEVTVPKGADGLIEVTTSIIELISDAAGDATGSSDTIDSTAETIGGKIPPAAVDTGPAVAEGQPPSTPTPKRSQTTELTTEVTVAK